MKKEIRLKKGPKKLPQFKSDLEMARFFDTHSVADYWDQMEDVDEVFVLAPALARRIRERMKKRLMSLRLEEWQIRRAREIARQKKIPYQALMREWITRGIRADSAKSRRAQ
jgi:hypothetical protein